MYLRSIHNCQGKFQHSLFRREGQERAVNKVAAYATGAFVVQGREGQLRATIKVVET